MPAELRVRAAKVRARLAFLVWVVCAGLPGCDGRELVLGTGRLARDRPGDSEDAGPGSLPGLPDYTDPHPIDALSGDDTTDDDPSLSGDRLELYFNSKRDGGAGHEDIWYSRRDTLDVAFREPKPAEALNTAERETGIALSSSALTIWFSSDREGGQGGLDVYRATRASRAEDWSTPEPVSELNSEHDDLVSSVSDSELSLLMARRDDDDSDYDVFSAERAAPDARWEDPQRLQAIDSDAEESDGCYASGRLRIIFTRDEELFLADRPDTSSEFRVVGPIAALNSEKDDRDAWAADDLSLIVFSSKRSGSYKLYAAESLQP